MPQLSISVEEYSIFKDGGNLNKAKSFHQKFVNFLNSAQHSERQRAQTQNTAPTAGKEGAQILTNFFLNIVFKRCKLPPAFNTKR